MEIDRLNSFANGSAAMVADMLRNLPGSSSRPVVFLYDNGRQLYSLCMSIQIVFQLSKIGGNTGYIFQYFQKNFQIFF